MTRKFGTKSLGNLEGLHPDLLRVVALALHRSELDFTVIEGLRSLARQQQLFKAGASKTMKSRHLNGFAADLWPIDPKTGKAQASPDGFLRGSPEARAADKALWDAYNKLGPAVKAAATELGIPITWGGDWTTFKDGPHFELPPGLYPDSLKFAKPNVAEIIKQVEAKHVGNQPAPAPAPAPAPTPTPGGTIVFAPGTWSAHIDNAGKLTITES